jgi:hypothetical protein
VTGPTRSQIEINLSPSPVLQHLPTPTPARTHTNMVMLGSVERVLDTYVPEQEREAVKKILYGLNQVRVWVGIRQDRVWGRSLLSQTFTKRIRCGCWAAVVTVGITVAVAVAVAVGEVVVDLLVAAMVVMHGLMPKRTWCGH